MFFFVVVFVYFSLRLYLHVSTGLRSVKFHGDGVIFATGAANSYVLCSAALLNTSLSSNGAIVVLFVSGMCGSKAAWPSLRDTRAPLLTCLSARTGTCVWSAHHFHPSPSLPRPQILHGHQCSGQHSQVVGSQKTQELQDALIRRWCYCMDVVVACSTQTSMTVARLQINAIDFDYSGSYLGVGGSDLR